MHASIGESTMASRTCDRSEIAPSISISPAFLKTSAPVFPSSELNHHSADSKMVAVTIKVPVTIHSWPDELRKAQLVTGSQKIFLDSLLDSYSLVATT